MTTLHEAARRVVAAWVSTRPAWVQECNAAVLALDEALKAEPAGCETETDCTSQPWCRISGECHRKQPESAQEPVAWNWMLDGQPYGQAYYGNPPDADIAERAAIAGRTVRLLYTAPLRRPPLTDGEIAHEVYLKWGMLPRANSVITEFARAVERKVRGEA